MSSAVGDSSEENRTVVEDSGTRDEGNGEGARSELGWMRYLLGVEAVLLVAGFVIDAVVGPVTDQTQLAHEIAGLLGAFAVFLGVVGLVVLVPVAYSTARAR